MTPSPFAQDLPEQPSFASSASQVVGLLVRLTGLALLAVGLWVGLGVIMEAWALYEQPVRIERLARAIEAGSNIDALVAGAASGGAEPAAPEAAPATPALKLSYYLAWVIAILLLLLIGRLAMSAVKTGGELALYDANVKRLARAMIEVARGR